MVLKLANQHRLAGSQHAAPPTMGNEIDRFGAVLGEDHLARVAGIEEARDSAARRFVVLGRRFAQPIGAAMHIGVALLHAANHGIDHNPGLLRRGAAIEKDQVLAADLLREDREIGADTGEIEAHARPRHQSAMAVATASRAGPSAMVSTTSCRKASINMVRAAGSGIPRARR